MVEIILLEFINTLHQSLAKLQKDLGVEAGMAALTIHQWNYLEAIGATGEATITEIAERLQITKASVTVGVNKLVALGYVEKHPSILDKRVVLVRLTGPGEQLIRTKQQALAQYGAFIRSALTRSEAEQFEATLAKLVRLFADGEQ